MEIAAIKMKVAELGQALELQVPGYIGILSQIHKEFREQPELLYRLDDAEIALVIAGLSAHHKTEIIDVKEKKPITKKAGANMSAEDV